MRAYKKVVLDFIILKYFLRNSEKDEQGQDRRGEGRRGDERGERGKKRRLAYVKRNGNAVGQRRYTLKGNFTDQHFKKVTL